MNAEEFLTRYKAGERDFRGVDLQGANLQSLQQVNLKGVNLQGANLQRAKLGKQEYEGYYTDTVILGAILAGANLAGANLTQADLEGVNLASANLAGANLTQANLQGANLKGANLKNANITQANLQGANLKGANLKNANITQANPNFQGINLAGANLQGLNFTGYILKWANLERANLQEVNLVGANLSSAKLNDSNLQGANLEDAILAYEDEEYFVGANLKEANIAGANLTRAYLVCVNLEGANLQGANLQEANLQEANLENAKLQGANFYKANLRLTNLKGTNFKRAERCRQRISNNASYNKENLQSQNLPLCNSQAAIAKAMGIRVQRLRFLAFSRHKSHYIRFQIPKKTGGYRHISAPMNLIKKAQKWILHYILEKLELHDAAHGFRRDRSIVTNAKPHVGKEVIINIDLKDFFPSISYKRVKGLFKSFGYSETVSVIFALICTEPKLKETKLDGRKEFLLSWTERYLPQGAPTSPAISNLLCRRLDKRLTKMAEEYGFVYTRYADDLTFSASGDSLQNICNVLKNATSIVNYEGFNINEDKTRILRKSRQQEVTGVVVNSKLNVDRETLKRFRATLYNIEKYGLRGRQWGQSNDLIASLQGFANFVYMVNPEKGAKLQEQVRRIKDKYGNKKPDEPLTLSNLISLTYIELRQLGWSNKERRKYLRETYGKQSLQQLTDEEILGFLNYLKYPPIKSYSIFDPSSADDMINIDDISF